MGHTSKVKGKFILIGGNEVKKQERSPEGIFLPKAQVTIWDSNDHGSETCFAKGVAECRIAIS